jgi:hypothetical protein
MAYQLKTDSLMLNMPVPEGPVNDYLVIPPQPSTEAFCCRPSTMEYGTAPYMAGKGAPAELIMVDDMLRPQTTSHFKKVYVKTYEKQVFPLLDMPCKVPLKDSVVVPQSSRNDLQNILYNQRYCRN